MNPLDMAAQLIGPGAGIRIFDAALGRLARVENDADAQRADGLKNLHGHGALGISSQDPFSIPIVTRNAKAVADHPPHGSALAPRANIVSER